MSDLKFIQSRDQGFYVASISQLDANADTIDFVIFTHWVGQDKGYIKQTSPLNDLRSLKKLCSNSVSLVFKVGVPITIKLFL